MTTTSRYRYTRLGTMTYTVRDAATGATVGTLWRTREGWGWRTPAGAAGEAYGVSRDVAAAALTRAAR